MKTDKTGLVRFCRFIRTDRLNFNFFKNLSNFEIKNPKKTSLHFKDFSENRIQKSVAFHCRKIKAGLATVKIKKSF
jgi:hypothetical protein